MAETRIVKEVHYFEYKELIGRFKGRISANPHAFFRLSEMQRKIYKLEELIELLTEEKPVFVGIQKNQNYAVFFSTKHGYLRLMCKITGKTIEIITFYITKTIPRI